MIQQNRTSQVFFDKNSTSPLPSEKTKLRPSIKTIWENTQKRISGSKSRTYEVKPEPRYLVQKGCNLYLKGDRTWGNFDEAQKFDFKKDASLVIRNLDLESRAAKLDKSIPYPEQVIKEFEISAIPDHIAKAYVNIYESGNTDGLINQVLINQDTDENGFHSSENLLAYGNLIYGGWCAKIAKLDGTQSDFTQIKPRLPRGFIDFKKGTPKTIKYESPKNSKTEPLIPFTEDRTVELELIEGIISRYRESFESRGLDTNPESYSSYVDFFFKTRFFLPVYVTEGFKKTLALMCQGYLAIGITGCWNWTAGKDANGHQITSQGTKKISENLRELMTGCQNIYLTFDSDENITTRKNVGCALSNFKKAIAKQCEFYKDVGHSVPKKFVAEVRRLVWECKYGKGVDDVFYNGYKLWDVATIYNPIAAWYESEGELTGDNLVKVNSRYLEIDIKPQIPIIGIKSKHGTGKTESLKQVMHFNGENYYLSFTGRISLAKEQSMKLGLGHIEDGKNDKYSGYSLCIDSILKVDFEYIQRNEKRLVVILDEVSQLFSHLFTADTDIKIKRSEKIARFQEMLIYAYEHGQIILADADLANKEFDQLRDLLYLEKSDFTLNSQIFVNEHQDSSCDIAVFEDRGVISEKLTHKVEAGQRVFVFTTSQRSKSKYGTKHLHKKLGSLRRSDGTKPKILVIDSETLAIVDSEINELRKLPSNTGNLGEAIALSDADVVICSPSVESGVSIDDSVKFDAVFGFSAGNIPVDNFVQGLFRVRHQCPRYIFTQKYGLQDPRSGQGLSSKDKVQSLDIKYKGLVDTFKYQGIVEDDNGTFGDDSNSLHVKSWARYNSYADIGKAAYRDCVIGSLKAKGHNVTIDTEDLYKEKKSIISQENKQEIAELIMYEAVETYEALPIDQNLADKLDKARTLTRANFNSLKRFKMVKKFSEDLLDTDAIAWDLESNVHPKTMLRWAIDNVDKIKFKELEKVKNAQTSYDKCNSTIIARAQFLKLLGFDKVLDHLLDGSDRLTMQVNAFRASMGLPPARTVYHKSDPIITEFVDRLSRYSAQANHVLGIKLNPENPIYVVNNLLRSVGYNPKYARCKTGDKRYYHIIPETPEREALRGKLLAKFDADF